MAVPKARQLRRTMTVPEQRLWAVLRNRQLDGHKFRRQHPVDCYVLDFACVEHKLAVEADGGQHVDDSARDAMLHAQGWRMLRFWNADILSNMAGVAETIMAALKAPRPLAGEGGGHAQHGRVREPSAPRPRLPHPAALPPPSPASGRGLEESLADHGLLIRGGIDTIVLIGTAGSAFWPHFQAGRRDEPNPLDGWSRRVLGQIAERFGAELLMPCDGPPYHPFQRWAMAAEAVYASPMGVLVHPRYGLWHAYRGALVLAEPIPLPPRPDLANPCDSCIGRPCVTACPVAAAVPYDVPGCVDHLNHGGACRTIGCHARHACPLGRDYAYSPDHAAFHMAAFVTAIWA